MKKILWLCSWYPNDYDKSAANFIQRQAIALSVYCDVYVLYIHPTTDQSAPYVNDHITSQGNLTEHLVYYRTASTNLFSKLRSIRRYQKIAHNRYRQYVNQYGSPDYIHAQVPIRAGAIARQISKQTHVPYALTEHYGIYNLEVLDPFEHRSFIYKNQVTKIIRDAKPLVVVSSSLGEDINKVVCKKDYIVVPNVVNTDIFHYREDSQPSSTDFIHVSNMIPLKNVQGILDAFKQVLLKIPSARLILVGRQSASVMTYASQHGFTSNQVLFIGEVDYARVAEYMQLGAALIMFSNTESMSCVVAEALCCGLPVISTSTGIARDLINESNGLLVNKRDVLQLRDAMIFISENNSTYNREIIAGKYAELFNYKQVGKQLAAIYGIK
jgi:glycosyltransferase involved in cell wall biosynthesis